MNLIRLLSENHIPFLTEGNKHCTRGWANVHCPFCSGSQNYHLGINLQKGYCFCWRCGSKPLALVLSSLLRLPIPRVKELIRGLKLAKYEPRNDIPVPIRRRAFAFPVGTGECGPRHIKYLEKRGFNAKHVISKHNLLATGPVGNLGPVDYKFRIIIPIQWEGKTVSFQGRDITGKSPMKYLACPKEFEVVDHKSILYANQELDYEKPIIIVEGVTDAWKIPYQTVACFGIQFKINQVKWIAERFKNAVLLFDHEPQAQSQAKKFQADLRMMGIKTQLHTVKDDPGSMTDEEAIDLIKEKLKLPF